MNTKKNKKRKVSTESGKSPPHKSRKRHKAEKPVSEESSLKSDVYLVAERKLIEDKAKEGCCYMCNKRISLPVDDIPLVNVFYLYVSSMCFKKYNSAKLG